MNWTRSPCILCTDSQQMLGNNLWSFNCMDCIAASWRPARIPSFFFFFFFPCGILICIYCTCCYPDGCLLKGTAAGGFRTFTWANKRANSSQTWSWPRALGVFGLFLFSSPSNLDSQGWEGPWNVLWAAKLKSIFCPVCVSWRKGTGQRLELQEEALWGFLLFVGSRSAS